MGGPGGVRGQPSTWLTQLVVRLLRHTEDPGWLADTHAGPHTYKYIHTHTHTHTYTDNTLLFHRSPWLSVTHTLQALSRLVASVLSGHSPPRWIQSAALSVNGTHTNIHTQVAAAFRLGRRGACCPSSVISSSLPPAISVPSALSALPPLLVSSHMATPLFPLHTYPLYVIP